MMVAALACAGAVARGEDSALKRFFARDVRVITVTDFTEAGKKLPPVSPASPVYCIIYNLGYSDFGPSWAGIKKPDGRTLLISVIKALHTQGYVVADELHPPTQALFFAWGALQGGSGARALFFLGGDKLDLMWEYQNFSGGMLDPRVLTRGIRTPLASKVWDISSHDLYLSSVRSYDPAAVESGELKLFWETRFACPADGLGMRESLPLMIAAAAPNLGVETAKPVSVKASKKYEGKIEYGELETIEMMEPAEAPPPAGAEKEPDDSTQPETRE